jgi:ABC-type transporter Mla subunit MlaD
MNAQRSAIVQAVLEGVALPATKDELIAYARGQEPDIVRDLQGLPDEEFQRLDDVGELLTLVPTARTEEPTLPRPESGKPPGGDDYLKPFPDDTGRVRDSS